MRGLKTLCWATATSARAHAQLRFTRHAATVSAIDGRSFVAGMKSAREVAGWEDARLMFNLAGIETVLTGPACRLKEYFAVALTVNLVFCSDWG
jgi:hypothetical protein